MKKVIQITSVVIAVLLGVGAAWAIPPLKGSDFFDIDFCADPVFELYDCGGGLKICEQVLIELDWKIFLDRDGNEKKYWEHQKLVGGLAEVGKTDNFLPYNPLSLTWTVDLIEGGQVITGIFALVTVPGYGQIFRDVGRIVFDDFGGELFFEAGEHEYMNEEFDAVCEYLDNN